jgi:type VI secretion system protein ImpF
MSGPRKMDRLAPPLMHAFRTAYEKRDARKKLDLRDEDGERIIAARRLSSRAPISEAGLRREVVRDLVNLMNTTNLAAAIDLDAAAEVRNSILNYGFPDLAHRTIDEHGTADIGSEIETALGEFEPRLIRSTIRARRDDRVDASELRLRFLVSAELRCQPVNVPVEFIAELEVDTGKIKIDRL